MRRLAALFLGLAFAVAAAASTGPKTSLVSVGNDGRAANSYTGPGSVSGDGRFVAFPSGATNLTPARRAGIFVRDRRLSRNERLPRAGGTGVRISSNGRFVAFCSPLPLTPGDIRDWSGDADRNMDVFVYDRQTRRYTRASVPRRGRNPNDWSCQPPREANAPELSADGRRVLFVSGASDLVRGDTNDQADIFVRDLRRHRTYRASIGPRGRQSAVATKAATISGNGRFVFFCSGALNWGVPWQGTLFVHDLARRRTTLAGTTAAGRPLAGGGCSLQPQSSADGRLVAFTTLDPEVGGGRFRQLVVKDRKNGRLELITRGINGGVADEEVYALSMSGDGRFVAFQSQASNLVRGDRNGITDVFLFDRTRRTMTRLNVHPDGGESTWDGMVPRISADGRFVLFHSGDPDLVPGSLPHWTPEHSIAHIFIRGPMH